jgi:hypothetical protein
MHLMRLTNGMREPPKEHGTWTATLPKAAQEAALTSKKVTSLESMAAASVVAAGGSHADLKAAGHPEISLAALEKLAAPPTREELEALELDKWEEEGRAMRGLDKLEKEEARLARARGYDRFGWEERIEWALLAQARERFATLAEPGVALAVVDKVWHISLLPEAAVGISV